MNEQLEKEEFSLLDLLKVLLSKIKLLILVLLCGGLLGGAIGYATSYNVYNWGTNIEFYVNPERPEKDEDTGLVGGSTYGVYGAYGKNVMDNIVRLLNSESFAELLILNGELLPQKGWADLTDEEEAALGLDASIDAAQEKIDEYEEKKAAYENEKTEENKAAYDDALNKANESIDETLLLWRKTKKYRETLSLYLESVEFSYREKDKISEDAVDLANSFLYVEISVLGDSGNKYKEIAETLLISIQSQMPKYVCAKMIIPDGFVSTSCTQITTLTNIGLVNEGYALKQSIKFALLLGLAAFVLACVVVIIIERSDKRVRDYDQLARQLNIPLLGVIPSINDDNMDTQKTTEEQDMEA